MRSSSTSIYWQPAMNLAVPGVRCIKMKGFRTRRIQRRCLLHGPRRRTRDTVKSRGALHYSTCKFAKIQGDDP